MLRISRTTTPIYSVGDVDVVVKGADPPAAISNTGDWFSESTDGR